MSRTPIELLNAQIVSCERCPRLREWCLRVAEERRASFADQIYWGLPVPNFGDADGTGLIVGLAPAAHGANRTGRMFTGDRSGEWLYRALYKAGLANQPHSDSAEDGLQLKNCVITAVCHCAPPDNKPSREEILACSVHLRAILDSRRWKAILCLGSIAWVNTHQALGIKPVPKFAHGAESETGVKLFGSYHPSQQNTFTGRLTEPMLDDVIGRFARACC